MKTDWYVLPCLAVILLTAFAFRVHDLHNESAWSDEFCSVVSDPESTFAEHMALNRFRNPDHVPIYYATVFFWSKLVGGSLLGVRLLSIAFSIAAIPIVFLLGRRAGGNVAGLTAALLYAISPYLIYLGQGARPYGMVLLLSALSLYTIVRAAESMDRRWWLANLVVNTVLIYVHLSGVFLLPAEGLYLLLAWKKRFRATAIWAVTHVLMIVPNIFFMNVPPEDPFFESPDLVAFAHNLLADDAIHLNIEMGVTQPAWGWLPDAAASWLLSNHALFDYLLLTCFALVLLWAVISLVRSGFGSQNRPDTETQWQVRALMVFVAVVPMLILLGISYAKEPMPMPRYSTFASIGLFVLAGALVNAMPLILRVIPFVLIVVAYGYQLAWFVPGATRTEWSRMIDAVEAKRTPHDVALIGSYGEIRFDVDQGVELILRYMLEQRGVDDLPVYRARTVSRMVDNAACYLAQQDTNINDNIRPQVWIFVFRLYKFLPLNSFEEALRQRGLLFEAEHSYAMEGLSLYRVARDFSKPVSPFGQTTSRAGMNVDFGEVLSSWDLEIESPSEQMNAANALASVLDEAPPTPTTAMTYAYLSVLIGEASANLALELARKAVELDPELATAQFAHGVALLQLGENTEAIDSFKRAKAAPPDEISALAAPVLDALIAEDRDVAAQEVRRIVRSGAPMPAGLQMVLGLYEPLNLCDD